MKTISTVALTEKGALKNSVRSAIASNLATPLADTLSALGFEVYADRNAYALAYTDINGNKVYATLTLTIGTKAPSEKARKKSGAKKADDTATIAE